MRGAEALVNGLEVRRECQTTPEGLEWILRGLRRLPLVGDHVDVIVALKIEVFLRWDWLVICP